MTSILRSIGFKKQKHTKLSEEWTDCQEPVKEGITFYCKYIGSTPIEQSSNATMTSHAVKHILSMAKAKGKKLPNIALFISPSALSGTVMADSQINGGSTGQEATTKEEKKDLKRQEAKKAKKAKKGQEMPIVELQEVDHNESAKENGDLAENRSNAAAAVKSEVLFNISIYRIPYCFAEATYDRIVAFVSTNPNGSHECHAIIAGKRKIAQSIALTISQAFDIAFDRLNNKNGNSKSSTGEESVPGINHLSVATISDDDSKSNSSRSSSSSSSSDGGVAHGKVDESFPTLSLNNRCFTSRRRRLSGKENGTGQSVEVAEDEQKKKVDSSSPIQLLINLEDEPKLNYPTTKLTEKPLLDLDDLRDLF